MSILSVEDRPSVGISELKGNPARLLSVVEAENVGRVITRRGRPIAAIVPLSHVILDQPDHRIEKIGIDSEVFLAQLGDDFGKDDDPEFGARWMADIRSYYNDDSGEYVGPEEP